MNKTLPDRFAVDWLSQPGGDSRCVIVAADLPSARHDWPYPPDLATGWISRLPVAEGVVLYQAMHRFHRVAPGRFLQLGKAQVDLPETSLWMRCVHSGQARARHCGSGEQTTLLPGTDVFALCQHDQYQASVETVEETDWTALAVSERSLERLMGEEPAQRLLQSLRLCEGGPHQSHAVPHHVTEPLRQARESGTTGALHALYAQSKVLEYLWNLARYTEAVQQTRRCTLVGRDTLYAVHEYLMDLEGALPTLDALARRFGASAQGLNHGFLQEFGQTIYACVTEHRLQQAYQVLLAGQVPIKTLSYRLGYSHPNHFTYAFKRRFGCTPGSLRGKPRGGAADAH